MEEVLDSTSAHGQDTEEENIYQTSLSHSPSDLTSSHKAPPPQGFTTSRL